ncbi:MAG: TVP38/TMEM64 family protein [Clostridiales bacterium]|nr:TVP38/TMEM64 family protein [Clostridiales bacterium]
MNTKNKNGDKKRNDTIRLILLLAIVVIMIGVTIALIPQIKDLLTQEGREALKERIDSFGFWGILVFIGIQILQIVIAFIPGEPIEIVAGILYGMWGGLAASIIGILIGTISVFYLVKLLGKPFVNTFFGEEKLNKFRILNDERKLELLTFILFLIPGTPKDILIYVVSLTKIKASRFFIIATLSRLPSVASSVLVGATLGRGNFILSIVIFLVTGAIGVVGIMFNDKLMKRFRTSDKE